MSSIITYSEDITGPTSSTDNAIARFDGTTGKLIQDSGITIDDSGNITIPSLTQGSVLFAGTGGLLSQDNSNLFWDNTNKRLGIGISPASVLNIYNASTNIFLMSHATYASRMRVDGGGVYWEFGTTADPAVFFALTAAGGTNNIHTKGRNFNMYSNSVAYGTGVFFNATTGRVGIGHSSPDQLFHPELTDSSTNTVLYPVRISRVSSGTPTAGIGTGLEFETETAAGNNEVGAVIEAVTTDVTATSEDFDLVFKTMSAGAAAAERMRITSDGRLYGTAIHNNAGAITGATNQYIASGTYTPTVTNSTNTDSAATATQAQYMRVGNVVTVSGRFTADPTLTATATSFELSLPIASNLGAVEDLAGTAFSGAIAGQGAEVIGVVANDTAKVQWIAGDVTSQTWSYTYTYEVI